MKGIKLFSSPGCHLCELGEEVLLRVQTTYKFEIEIVDISSSEELVEKYGIMIPVLLNTENGKHLYWPFNAEEIIFLLNP